MSQLAEDEIAGLVAGAVDMHVHCAPDGLAKRRLDAFQAVRAAKAAGMRAVVLKNKGFGTGGIAHLANEYADGALAVGSITLDVSVGGINPEAVAIQAALGSRVVWMPTYSSHNDTEHGPHYSAHQNSVSIVGEDGNLLPAVIDVLEIIRDNEMVLATGHVSQQEAFALVPVATQMGIAKVVVSHPMHGGVNTEYSFEDQRALCNFGAYMEHCWALTTPLDGNRRPEDLAEAIRAVGVDRCVLASDLGQPQNPSPADGFRDMLRWFLGAGFTVGELECMVKVNPTSLLGLQDT